MVRFWSLILGLATAAILPSMGSAQTLPQYGDANHLGVQTCASSTCHGSVQPWPNSSVLQNEAVTWSRHDAHSGAYNSLGSERGLRIAANLGIGDPRQAGICLDCHADNIPAANRGPGFNIADGVTCEACHGGAEQWLGGHLSGQAREDNIAAGMYPTDRPIARARLCLSCHYGNEQKFVTHRIMGAGHPRLTFELDTYTFAQPAHFRVDDDYRQRKPWANGVKMWAIGQAVAVQEILEALTDANRNSDGIFPELVFFDCHACHHPMSNLRWQARDSVGLGPGVPRLNDGNLVMLRVVAGVIDPALGDRIESQTRALHQASTEGYEATQAAAAALRETMNGVVSSVSGHSFTGDEMTNVLNALLNVGLDGEYVDYIAAEQATLAISTAVAALESAGRLQGDTLSRVNEALETAYAAVQNDEDYKPDTYVAALQEVRTALQ